MKKLQFILTASLAVDCFGAAGVLDGVWRSQGWGLVYQVRGADWQAFEVTSTTCVAGTKAKRITSARPGSEATFQIRRGDVFSIVDDGGSDHKRITTPTGLTSIAIERIDALPKACTPPTGDTPSNNLEVFVQTFAEQYISFDLRHVDWDRVIVEQRGKVTDRTTPAELFETLLSG